MLPARPMVTRTVSFGDAVDHAEARARVAAIVGSTPDDAVVRLRVIGRIPAMLTADTLREIAGQRNVTLAVHNAANVRNHGASMAAERTYPGTHLS